MPESRLGNVLAFSPRFSPDPDSGRHIHGLGDLPDEDCARAMQQSRGQVDASLPAHLQRLDSMVVAGSINGQFILHGLDYSAGEPSLLADFYRRLADKSTLMVSWQGSLFTPILRCRALIAGVPLSDRPHLDIAEWLAGSGANSLPLHELALQVGLPVADSAPEELPALQIYLLYLRLQRLRGQLEQDVAELCEKQVRAFLQNQDAKVWQECLSSWTGTGLTSE